MPPKTKATPKEVKPEARHSPLFDLSRKVLLAAVGAVALAQDEIEEFVQRLVDRGEIAEKEGRSLIQEILEQRKKAKEEIRHKAGQRLNEAFARMDLPTRQDIEQLQQKINELTEKIEQLKQQ